MGIYDEVKTLPEMKDLMILQLGKALYDIEPTRALLKEKKALPRIGTPYTLVELGLQSSKNAKFGEEMFELPTTPVTFQVDTVKYYQTQVKLTSSSGNPSEILDTFIERIQDSDWYDPIFKWVGLSVVEVGDVLPADLPVEGGEWEIRNTLDLAITYYAKRSRVTNGIDKISYGLTTKGDNMPDIKEDGVIGVG